jgi:hypothetical protein
MSTLACVTARRTNSREINPDTDSLAALSQFRQAFYNCLTARGDELFELAEAVLCTDGPVKTLVDLALAPEHRRGHGALYDGLNHGRIEPRRFRKVLAGLPLPRAADGRIVLAADVSPWLRPDAATCPDRSFCHTYGRGKNEHRMIPGWPYSIIAALETGRTSWTALLDAIRLEPGAQARRRVRVRQPGDLGQPAGADRHRHHPVRHRARPGLGPATPPADPPSRLGRLPRRAPPP